MNRAERYEARKLAGLCTYPSTTQCPDAPEDGGQLCPVHADRKRESDRTQAAAARAERRSAGLCAEGCGVASERYRCPACAVRSGHFPSMGVGDGVGNQPTEDRQWRAGTHASDAMTARYRGRAVRGQPPLALIDDQDLARAAEAIAKARRALEFARSPEVAALPRIQRQAAVREALGYVGHSARFGAAVLARHKLAPDVDDDVETEAWEFAGGAGEDIARDAAAGELVYAPPPAAQAGRPDAKAPDLAALRRALADRRLALEGCGAFYWRVVAICPVVAISNAEKRT